MPTLQKISHSGWDKYYKGQGSLRSWNGIPDQYLLDHFEDILLDGAQTVIDIAAGDGRNTEPFLNQGLNVVAIDLSISALENFNARCASGKQQQPILICGDFINSGLLAAQFDCAVCFNSVPHFESPALCIETISKLLKPGGRAAFNAFTPGDVAYGLGEMVSENVYTYQETLFTFMTEDEVKSILPNSVEVVHSETRRWEEPDHGSYRSGTHTHEACFFILEKRKTI